VARTLLATKSGTKFAAGIQFFFKFQLEVAVGDEEAADVLGRAGHRLRVFASGHGGLPIFEGRAPGSPRRASFFLVSFGLAA